MKVNEDVWKFIQQHLGYTDEELELFRSNPKNTDIVSKARLLQYQLSDPSCHLPNSVSD
jgi:hypothetical protein